VSAVGAPGDGLPKGVVLIAATDARINDRIRAREVFLVSAEGERLGVKPLPEALQLAREQELDLVEVAPNANPPVCRIMDFGKYKYDQEQRRKESRKKTNNIVVKEMKFRPKIDGHDYTTKMKHVERFLGEGAKVKLTIMFRGREMAHPELGLKILNRIADDLSEDAIVEFAPKQDGRNMTMVLAPTKKPETKKAKAPRGDETGEGADLAVDIPANPTESAAAPVAPAETAPVETTGASGVN
jgi:translation initiation factor IF-3